MYCQDITTEHTEKLLYFMRLTEVFAASPLCPQVLFSFSFLLWKVYKLYAPLDPSPLKSSVSIPYYAIKRLQIPGYFY